MYRFIQPEDYIQPFGGHREADVAPGENQLDSTDLGLA